jgi:hypothetical protein
MTEEHLPRIRRGAIPPDAVLVVRGDAGDPALAREQAEQFRRRFPAWERWGLSAFYARGDDEVDDLAFDRLHQFGLIRLYRVGDLEAAGFELVPTFRSPHVTVAWQHDLDEGLARFDAAPHESRTNPYHG